MGNFRPKINATSHIRLEFLAERLQVPKNAMLDMLIGMGYELYKTGAFQPSMHTLPTHLVGRRIVQVSEPITINLEDL